MFSSKDLFFTPAATGAYTVSKSLRFRSSASAYLNRTPGSAGDRQKWTWSAWIKRGSIATQSRPFAISDLVSNEAYFQFNSNDTFTYSDINSLTLTTTQVFRDPSAWYHIVITLDTTQATAANRVLIYVNGAQVTSFSTATYPAQNSNEFINTATATRFGGAINNVLFFDGYFAEVNFIGGSALLPTDFGAYDTNGIWQPKAYTGSYSGTNSFYLKFTTVGATSGSNTGYGQDFSGNGNYWTTNNFGTTSTSSTYDSMLDSPTNATGDIGNYAVFNPLIPSTGTISNGNLYVSTTTTNATSGTILQTSGKWYAEVYINSNGGSSSYIRVGVCNSAGVGADLGGSANGWAYLGDARVYNNGSTSSYGVTSTTGDTINVALDLDNGKVWYGKNGTWMASGNPATGANPSQTFTANQSMTFAVAAGSGTPQYYINFGQIPFSTAAPSGFSALNTQNLSTPTITNGAQYMAAVTYTGNGTTTGNTQTITASSTNSGNNPNSTTFQPDFVWIKCRSSAVQYHILNDSVRGTNKILYSNTTDTELSTTNVFNSFNSDGFTAAYNSTFSNTVTNANGSTYVAWEWKAGSSTTTNTSGSLTSTVNANTTAGFSIVTYTGNSAANQTVGHGLGVTPALIIVKCRSQAATNWVVWNSTQPSLTDNLLQLNTTASYSSIGTIAQYWGSSAPNSTVFGVKSGGYDNNQNGQTHVAYCFAAVASYSAFGSYTGNGSTDGPFVYTGFRPRWVLIKNTGAAVNWFLFDTSRNTYNVVNTALLPNAGDADWTLTDFNMDILSNGFKIRTVNNSQNTNAVSYIYAAFAENPFKISRAR